LTRTRRFLNEARFSGLVTHLFAIRALFPDAIGDTHATTLTATREALRESLDRLFIKLRLPNYVVAPRDIETPSFRATVERFALGVGDARGTPAQPAAAALILRGECDVDAIHEIGERLAQAPLAGALSWNALARMLPGATPALAEYRDSLVDVLDELSDAETIEFLDALQRKAYPDLDAALQAVRETLAR